MVRVILVVALFFVSCIGYSQLANAWDSGPSGCKTNPCSGGKSKTVALQYTDLAFDNWTPIHSPASCPYGLENTGFACVGGGAEATPFPAVPHYAVPVTAGFENSIYHATRKLSSYSKALNQECKSGYVNMGKFCLRGATTGGLACKQNHYCDKNLGKCFRRCPKGFANTGSLCTPQVLSKKHMTCAEGMLRYNAYCFPEKYDCPGGYQLWGSRCTRCYKRCPSGWFRSDVSTCSFRLRWRGNTHLWIADKALELLKESSTGKKAYDFMNHPKCGPVWVKALYEASEYKSHAQSNNAHPHYYNAAGKDYYGSATKIKTYAPGGSPNAYNVINTQLHKIDTDRCKAIGTALHYVIDLTNPAHTSGFGPKQNPAGLVAALEAYVPTIQHKYPPNTPWEWRWKHHGPLPIVDEISKRSNLKFARALFNALLKKGAVCKMQPPYCYQTYAGYCFVNDPEVKTVLGATLRDAYHSVASWIYSICEVRNFKWE